MDLSDVWIVGVGDSNLLAKANALTQFIFLQLKLESSDVEGIEINGFGFFQLIKRGILKL